MDSLRICKKKDLEVGFNVKVIYEKANASGYRCLDGLHASSFLNWCIIIVVIK